MALLPPDQEAAEWALAADRSTGLFGTEQLQGKGTERFTSSWQLDIRLSVLDFVDFSH